MEDALKCFDVMHWRQVIFGFKTLGSNLQVCYSIWGNLLSLDLFVFKQSQIYLSQLHLSLHPGEMF